MLESGTSVGGIPRPDRALQIQASNNRKYSEQQHSANKYSDHPIMIHHLSTAGRAHDKLLMKCARQLQQAPEPQQKTPFAPLQHLPRPKSYMPAHDPIPTQM
jgi:hypothetical protein